MADKIRAFVGIRMPDELVAFFRDVRNRIQSYGLGLKLVKPENIHITLKFLGDIEIGMIEHIGKATEEATKGYSPILLSAKGIGCFPGIRKPRILWAGLKGQVNKLMEIQLLLDHKLELIGFPKENRPFRGHLTVGRFKKKINHTMLESMMADLYKIESTAFAVSQIILFQSTLKASGPIYTERLSITIAE